ncbi:hypothetical protein AB6806_27690 [Bosea sp. RCC_152_1]|uniref:hypothetical protein n=1 Tax=Bosea sp. RCC_152_1 TaxID=3239228 RepID=UPI0035267AF8
MSADTAPAAMPGERELADEVEREMMSWRGANGGVFTLRACAFAIAQKVACLFAPILAEKERLGERVRELSLLLDKQMGTPCEQIRHRQEVEAAVAAERERCAKIAEDHGALVSNEPIGKACSRNIAAAIRAQGE